jgi:hypothetical protein
VGGRAAGAADGSGTHAKSCPLQRRRFEQRR